MYDHSIYILYSRSSGTYKEKTYKELYVSQVLGLSLTCQSAVLQSMSKYWYKLYTEF